MNAVSLRRQLPLIKLSATALLLLLLAGTVFLVMRYMKLSGQGESFPFTFETSRMLVNFGGLALLSPIAYGASTLAFRQKRLKIPTLIFGLVLFATAYLLLNKAVLLLINSGQVTTDFWKGSRKLFLNFGHIITLTYAALVYGSLALLKRKDPKPFSVNPQPASLAVKVDGIERALLLSEISHIQANDHYLRLHDRHRFYLIRKSLKRLQNELPDDFIQIHRSTIVNQQYVTRLIKENGRLVVVLRNGTQLRVSASYEKAVLQLVSPID